MNRIACFSLFTLATTTQGDWSTNPPPVPVPPAVLDLRPGRQLFVDDWLIESTDLTRTYHRAVPHPANPVLKADQSWEDKQCATTYSDGVWWDGQQFRMYYQAGGRYTALAVSPDGLSWSKPDWGVVPGTAIVVDHGDLGEYAPGEFRNSASVWHDHNDPQYPWKLTIATWDTSRIHLKAWIYYLYLSQDGIHWSKPILTAGQILDRSTLFWNPFRNKWGWVIKAATTQWPMRARRLFETDTFTSTDRWDILNDPHEWISADNLDPKRIDFPNQMPEIYNLDVNAYESVLLGLFAIWQGQPAVEPKYNSIMAGYSRDGFNFHRPDRNFLWTYSNQTNTWNYRNTQSAGGACLVVGDDLYFYASAYGGAPGSRNGPRSVGLFKLRRDGFASMGRNGTLTTRPFRLDKPYVFLNFDGGTSGTVATEVLDEAGNLWDWRLRKNYSTAYGNGTTAIALWRDRMNLAGLVGQTIRLRFHVKDAELYSFWLSDSFTGPSHGYSAAGGPGLNGPKDESGVTLAPTLSHVPHGNYLRVMTSTLPGYIYEFQEADLTTGPWRTLHTIYGTGQPRGALHSTVGWQQKFYRVCVR